MQLAHNFTPYQVLWTIDFCLVHLAGDHCLFESRPQGILSAVFTASPYQAYKLWCRVCRRKSFHWQFRALAWILSHVPWSRFLKAVCRLCYICAVLLGMSLGMGEKGSLDYWIMEMTIVSTCLSLMTPVSAFTMVVPTVSNVLSGNFFVSPSLARFIGYLAMPVQSILIQLTRPLLWRADDASPVLRIYVASVLAAGRQVRAYHASLKFYRVHGFYFHTLVETPDGVFDSFVTMKDSRIFMESTKQTWNVRQEEEPSFQLHFAYDPRFLIPAADFYSQ